MIALLLLIPLPPLSWRGRRGRRGRYEISSADRYLVAVSSADSRIRIYEARVRGSAAEMDGWIDRDGWMDG